MTIGEENEFMGQPRPEQSKAWKDAYGNCEKRKALLRPLSHLAFPSSLPSSLVVESPRPKPKLTVDLRPGIHIRVQKSDLDKINRTSIPLADGSGYLASLDVFHQLHCVYVRFSLFSVSLLLSFFLSLHFSFPQFTNERTEKVHTHESSIRR